MGGRHIQCRGKRGFSVREREEKTVNTCPHLDHDGNLSLVRSRIVMNDSTMEGQNMNVIKGITVFIGRCVYWSD